MELANRKWMALASHRTWLWGKPKGFFLSDDLSIRLEAATTLTRRDDRQRPVTVQPTSPPDTFSQPQESFTLTLSLISSVGRRLRLRRILLGSRLWRAIGSNQAGVRSRRRPIGRVECQGCSAPGCRSTSHRYLNDHTGAVLGSAISGCRGGIHQ